MPAAWFAIETDSSPPATTGTLPEELDEPDMLPLSFEPLMDEPPVLSEVVVAVPGSLTVPPEKTCHPRIRIISTKTAMMAWYVRSDSFIRTHATWIILPVYPEDDIAPAPLCGAYSSARRACQTSAERIAPSRRIMGSLRERSTTVEGMRAGNSPASTHISILSADSPS